MKLAIMQPYLCPYLGYFQLIEAVDTFVVYDNIQFSKKGWFAKNNILLNNQAKLFSIPIKKDSDYLNVNERFLADNSQKEASKILAQIKNGYRKAPYFDLVFPIVSSIFQNEVKNLFDFIHSSIRLWCEVLDITTQFVISSTIDIEHSLKGEDKVVAICKELGATSYINAPGGKSLYSHESFSKEGIDLQFIQPELKEYDQFSNDFVSNLSIIDVLMFNGPQKAKEMLQHYTLD